MSLESRSRKAEHGEQMELLIEDLKEAYRVFTLANVCQDLVRTFQTGTRSFLGVNTQLEGSINLWDLRQNLLEMLGGRKSSILQVVGDSGQGFEEQSLPRAFQILSEQAGPEYVVQYGYTAMRYDTNWLVAEHIQQSPDGASGTIANIVEQSIGCLQDSSWDGSLSVTNFLVLYSQNEGTSFGDDVWLSDGIMFASSDDKLICFEGGSQALHQCTNMLLKGIQVVAVTGLRPAGVPMRFSAAQLLGYLKTTDTCSINSTVNEYLGRVLSRDAEKFRTVEGFINRLIKATHDWKSLISVL